MAVFGFLIGSIFGLVAGVTSWVAFDVSLLGAMGIYLGLGVTLGFTFAIQGCVRTTLGARLGHRAFS
ncbi:hypothetical protein ACN2XU_11235 [Primorskyibacter sp. 2E107]|uniref:hypothetical protein n=1 Tax=Primorskyibacter sp. 2E107 TaxID=3403458 RepID=UPI003AF8BD1A